MTNKAVWVEYHLWPEAKLREMGNCLTKVLYSTSSSVRIANYCKHVAMLSLVICYMYVSNQGRKKMFSRKETRLALQHCNWMVGRQLMGGLHPPTLGAYSLRKYFIFRCSVAFWAHSHRILQLVHCSYIVSGASCNKSLSVSVWQKVSECMSIPHDKLTCQSPREPG